AVAGTGQFIGTLLLSSDGNLSIIPEPSAALLGLAGLGLCFRRRRNA
ncbi:MAG: PEP-CTERM sorting domain-containing protein, partial [Verrucomicrobiaceae bacterium]